MTKRLVARLLVLVALLAAILPGRPVLAADTVPTITLAGFYHPTTVMAGGTITFTADAIVKAGVGVTYGTVALEGPSGQSLSLRLVKQPGADRVKGDLTLSPNTPAGTWKVTSLYLAANDGKSITYKNTTEGFKHEITVTAAAGKAADTKGPQLLTLSVPAEVNAGEAVTITATASDDLAGVDDITAYMEPVDEKPAWTYGVTLFPTGKAGEYSGTMLMDAGLNEAQQVYKVVLTDKAGNRTTVDDMGLLLGKSFRTLTKGKDRKVPDGLVTSPYLNLIYPGNLSYYNWLYEDYKHLYQLLKDSADDLTGVREQLTAELPQIRLAVDALRKEIYVDPTTKLKVSPMATTGKWLALDRALDARLALLTELERQEGKSATSRKELTASFLSGEYTILDQGDAWLPADASFEHFSGQFPAAYLYILSQSPDAVKVLKAQADESARYGPTTSFDRDVLYFEPIITTRNVRLIWGTSAMSIPINTDAFSVQVEDLFYEIGRHFGSAYLADADASGAGPKWAPYLQVRGNQTWPDQIGYLGTPTNNLGDDFAFTYLPLELGKQYWSRQSYQRLRENPTMAAAFKKFADDRIQKGATATSINPPGLMEVGVSNTFQVTIDPVPASAKFEAEGIYYGKDGLLRQVVPATRSGTKTTFSSADAQTGRVTFYYFQALNTDGLNYYRYFTYFRAPLVLDPLPAATNKKSLHVTGLAPAGAKISVASVSAVADAQGRFAVDVPLTKGENALRFTVSGSTLAAAETVTYEPEGTVVPLKVTLPGISQADSLEIQGITAPYAIVTINDERQQADSKGQFDVQVSLAEGANKVSVSAVSPAGNKATYSAVVVKDTTPPVFEVSLPMQTNQPVYKIKGRTEAGATVTADDTVVPVNAEGVFETSVTLTEGKARHIEFVAADPAGNRSTVAGDITYVSTVPAVSRESNLTLTGKVEPGTTLKYGQTAVDVAADGSFRLPVAVNVGRNTYVLLAAKDGKYTGFLEFQVINPLKIDSVVAVGNDQVKISGRTVPGYYVMVNGEMPTVSDQGDWSVTIPRSGTHVTVIVNGDGQTYKETADLP